MQDIILSWNSVALEANRVSHTEAGKREQNGPTLSSRAMAIVHLAMYDAFAGVIKDPVNLPPYLPGLPPAPNAATTRAAVSAAAHRTLTKLYTQQVATFDAQLATHGDPANPGHAWGIQVADALLADRAADPNADSTGYVPLDARGKHRVDPDNAEQGFHAAFYGAKSKGFAITARHGLDAPPLDNDEYLQALRQVRAKGIKPELIGTLPDNLQDDRRTAEETVIGIYWGYDGAAGLGTPPRMYNQIIRVLAQAKNNTDAENARLFALVNAAMGDAGILAWDQKYIHNFWRPVVGIREHDRAFGPSAPDPDDDLSGNADPDWLPLGAPSSNSMNSKLQEGMPNYPCSHKLHGIIKNFTPPFPAYPSGHATFGAAALHMARLFYGVNTKREDDLFDGLNFVSEEYDGNNQDNQGTVRPKHQRSFDGGLWQMIVENGLSRVYLGVHWVFDAFKLKSNGEVNLSKNVGGVPLGLKIAEDIFNGGRAKGLKKSPVGPR